jgi:nitrite reductase/ring-hydroxylating ferredoxin subunit
MGLIKRLLGICNTQPPGDASCWKYVSGNLEIDLARAPELSGTGGAIRIEGARSPERVLVFRGDDGELHAFVNRCSHMGRRLDPLPGQGVVQCCSVGKATHDYDGEKKSGLARGAIVSLQTEENEGRLTIILPGS